MMAEEWEELLSLEKKLEATHEKQKRAITELYSMNLETLEAIRHIKSAIESIKNEDKSLH